VFISTIAAVAQTTENAPAIRDPGSPTSLLCYPPPKTQTRVSINIVGDPGVD